MDPVIAGDPADRAFAYRCDALDKLGENDPAVALVYAVLGLEAQLTAVGVELANIYEAMPTT